MLMYANVSVKTRLEEEIDFFFKIPDFKILKQIKQIYLPYLFTFWILISLILIF